MNKKEIFGRLASFGLYDKMTTPDLPDNVDEYVVAGNPGMGLLFPKPIEVPDTFNMGGQECYKRDFTFLTVSGNSMSPCGIYSGYKLLLKPIHTHSEISVGDYIVIAVDKAFFKFRHHGQNPHFSKKLRRAIGSVYFDEKPEQLTQRLVGTFAEAFTPKERKDLRNSLAEARKFYSKKPLFLSATYHQGEIHYSFHPIENIKDKVAGAAFTNENGEDISFVKADALAS